MRSVITKTAAIVLAVWVCGVAVPVHAQSDVEITMSLDRGTIGMNETATLTISVSCTGQQQLPEPKLPPLPQFQIFSAGSSTNLEIVNGAMSYSVTYNYLLSPTKEGTFPIRPATILVNSKRYESNELSITVTKSGAAIQGPGLKESLTSQGDAKDLFLVAEVDKKTAYVDEQVTLRVKFYRGIRLLSTPNYEPPQTPGFWTNDIPPQKQYYQTVNGRDYLVNEIRTALFPTKPGKLEIGPARVTAAVPDRSQRRTRDPFSFFDDVLQQGRNVEVASRGLTVDVRPLPAEGKTDIFSGGVGSYRISASVDKTDVVVNEAISLTVKISGRGNVKSIPEPALPEMDGFRVEEVSTDHKVSNVEDEIGGTKTFEYLLIPRLPGSHTIKPIILNYFDPGVAQYRSTSTDPIELTIRQGDMAVGAEIPYNMVSGQTINLKETDIRFIKPQDGRLARRGRILLTSPAFIIAATLPLLVVFGGLIDVRRRQRLMNDIGYARQRRAGAEAKKRLKQAEEYLHAEDDGRFYAEISAVIYQLIADKLNLSAHGLTSDAVRGLLAEKAIAEELLSETLQVLAEADFGRFAGGAGAGNARGALFDRARRVATQLLEVL